MKSLFNPKFILAATNAINRVSMLAKDDTADHYLSMDINARKDIEYTDELNNPCINVYQFKMALEKATDVVYVATYNKYAYEGELIARKTAEVAVENELIEQIYNIRRTLV
jgi:hypothetical protein